MNKRCTPTTHNPISRQHPPCASIAVPRAQKMGTQPSRRAHFFYHPAPFETIPLLRVDAVFERLARLERNGITGLDFHRLTGLWVFAGAGAAVALQEGAEANQGDAVLAVQGAGDFFENGVEDAVGLFFDTDPAGHSTIGLVPEIAVKPIIHRLKRDAMGRLSAKVTDDGHTQYTYDVLGQLTGVHFMDTSGHSQTLGVSYDALG